MSKPEDLTVVLLDAVDALIAEGQREVWRSVVQRLDWLMTKSREHGEDAQGDAFFAAKCWAEGELEKTVAAQPGGRQDRESSQAPAPNPEPRKDGGE